MTHILRFIKDQAGAEIAEYAVAVALLAAIAVIVYNTLGTAIADQNSGTGARIKDVPRTAPF